MRRLWRRFAGWLHERMPKGLYARALLILILPIVLLQSAVAYVYMERHWEAITDRLSA
ncbi:MAG TPA: two-component sensor histidine kinase, partial [Methylocystis sp.]